MKPESAISVSHLVQQHPFDQSLTLDDISVEIPKDRLTVVLGKNGCGKSTLLNCIAGITPFISGTIEVAINGHTPYTLTGTPAPMLPDTQRKALGIVFQQMALWPHFTVRDNLCHPLRRVHTISTEEALRERVGPYFDRLRLDMKLLEKYPAELSGGEQRKVALARTLVIRPQMLIVDEIEANLDQPSLDCVLDVIDEDFVSQKKTVVMICHRPDVMERFAPFVVVLHPQDPNGEKVVTAPNLHELRKRQHSQSMQEYIASVSEPPPQLSFRDRCLTAAQNISRLTLCERDEQLLFQRLGEQISTLITQLDPLARHLLLIATPADRDYVIRSAEITNQFTLDGKDASELLPILDHAALGKDGSVLEYRLKTAHRDIIRRQCGIRVSGGAKRRKGVGSSPLNQFNGVIDRMLRSDWQTWKYEETDHSELVMGAYSLGIPVPEKSQDHGAYNEYSTQTKNVYLIAIQVDDEVKGAISIDTSASRRWPTAVMKQLVAIANFAAIAIKQLENDQRREKAQASSRNAHAHD